MNQTLSADITRTGINRTGSQIAPERSKEAAEFAQSQFVDAPTDELDYVEFHLVYIAESDAIGAVPQPKSIDGKAKTLVSKMRGDEPSLLIDKLGERLAFERTGVRLYEALITKCSAEGIADDLSDLGLNIEQMRVIRDDEASHLRLIDQVIRVLGGDPTAVTPCADVAGVNALGILQTMTDPRTSVAQALNTMLTVELTDNSGWELLIEIAQELGHDEIVESFKVAEHAEAEHLDVVRTWVRTLLLSAASRQS